MGKRGMRHSSDRTRVDHQVFSNLSAEQITTLLALVDDADAIERAADAAAALVAVPITATANGLTTGLIPATAKWIEITSGNADHIITLPAIADVELGAKIEGLNGGTACEMRTPATSNTKINGTDGDSLESVIAANAYICAQKISATGWRLTTQVGATIASPVPD